MGQLKTIEDFKPLIGKVIFAIPKGNAARNRDDGYFESFKVVSVARKYVKLTKVRDDREFGTDSYLPESGATQDAVKSGYGGNSGYHFFLSLEEILSYREMITKKSEIASYFRDFRALDMDDSDIESIHAIISKYSKQG